MHAISNDFTAAGGKISSPHLDGGYLSASIRLESVPFSETRVLIEALFHDCDLHAHFLRSYS